MSTELESRLDFAQFTPKQRETLSSARERLAQLIPPALDRFYGQAGRTPETMQFFRDAAHMDKAKQAQMRHWQHLADAKFDGDYNASVRRIGERHAIIGLQPRWYIGAYILVLEDLIRGLGKGGPFGLGSNRALETVIAVVKAALIDMEISVSIYFERSEAAQKQVVGELEEKLARLAQGDMTVEIHEAFEASYEPVRTNFNSAVKGLRELVGHVIRGTGDIQTSAGEIAQASEDLARRTESNAASLEQTTAAVAQMDDRLKEAALGARRTVERADGAIATVHDGRSIADEAVQAMGRVSESAKGIDSVIEGLDKIAFQTRVLAMNAAVEAGRAGEAGRGFAVVADLVSALAMRAEEEAGRARDQLTATQSDIGAAVGMVQKVDGALSNISGDVSEVHRLLADIAGANEAQSSAITQISAAIGMMDQATQQNAAMVEEASAAARSLSSDVTRLADQAGRFSLDDKPEHRRGVAALSARAPTPKSRPAPSPARATALPPASAPQTEDWTSF